MTISVAKGRTAETAPSPKKQASYQFPLSLLGGIFFSTSIKRLFAQDSERRLPSLHFIEFSQAWSAFKNTVHCLQAADPDFTALGYEYA